MTEHLSASGSASPEARRLFVHAVQRSDVGKVRSENQDFAILTSPHEENEAKGRLMIVADGMGGHRGGATASRMAATTIKTEFLSSETDDIGEILKRSLENANARIWSEAQTNPDLRGMGTTCSALVVRGGEAFFAHVGDSRIYLVRAGEIKQLTEDHSLVASMVKEGLLTSKEAEVHPRRNVLQRSVGVSEDVEVDVSQPLAIQAGDTFILCSDGLYGLVKENEILEVGSRPIDQAANEFVKRAIERGAPDNVTVIVARVEERPQEYAPGEKTDPIDATATVEAPDPRGKTITAKVEATREVGLFKWVLIGLLSGAVAGAMFLVWSLSRQNQV